MRILLTGATGFIGKALCLELTKRGHDLSIVTRRAQAMARGDWGLPSRFVDWNPAKEACPIDLEDFDAVVNLLGESVAGGRWTQARKDAIYASRIESTRNLVAAIARRRQPLPCFVQASAIGYYPLGTAIACDESTAPGADFLAKTCRDWEAASVPSKSERTLLLRIGVVLGAEGGALETIKQPFEWGIGGPLGSGQQLMSWIHLDDLVAMICQGLEDSRMRGPINCVAPEVVTQKRFAKTLGQVLRRPSLIPTPAWVLRLVLGEMSQLALGSQNIAPARLRELGFKYRYPTLEGALREACNLVKGRGPACQRLSAVQFVGRPLTEVFDFFCDPHNLERITPPLLSFKIASISSAEITAGTIIRYRLRVRGIPMSWLTRIEDWQAGRRFVDNQEQGPYRIWHHTHEFYEVPGGTLMTDCVRFKVPMGWLGERLALPMVRKDVGKIFSFRRQVIHELFGN